MVRKGRKDIHGILLIDKPDGMTSAAVVGKLQRRLFLRKVGHAGTLDPIATGLLPICINEATKLAGHLSSCGKRYQVVMRLGQSTDTYDRQGEVIETLPVNVSQGDIEKALGAYRGSIMQIPPAYSAKKRNGTALYKLARKGREVLPEPVPVFVESLELEDFDGERATLSVHASKGFYVRSLCHDLGRDLGCGAHVDQLRRVVHGSFEIEHAVSFQKIMEEDGESWQKHLLSLESKHIDIPLVEVDSAIADLLSHGHPIPLEQAKLGLIPLKDGKAGIFRALGPDGRMLALLRLLHDFSEWDKLPSGEVVWKVERGIVLD